MLIRRGVHPRAAAPVTHKRPASPLSLSFLVLLYFVPVSLYKRMFGAFSILVEHLSRANKIIPIKLQSKPNVSIVM